MSDSYVYFIRPIGMLGPVKIGYSAMPANRLDSLATWSPVPLEIVATTPGGSELERNIHECFAEDHSHREWFRASDRLARLILDLRAGVPLGAALDLTDKRGKMNTKGQGGAGWSVATRRRMGVMHRINHASRKRGLASYMHAPRDVYALIDVSQERELNDAELALLDSFLRAA